MSAGTEPSTEPSTEPGDREPAPDRQAPLWQRVAVDLPLRVPLLLVWCSVAVTPLLLVGWFRPLPVVLALLAAAAATYRTLPLAAGARVDAVAAGWALAVVGLVVVFVVVNKPFAAHNLLLTRDPDVYTLTAWWLVGHASPGIDPGLPSEGGSLAFPLEDGLLRPQGQHLVPALAAVVGWVDAPGSVLTANLLVGGVALLALYALARSVTGPGWAVLAPVAMGLSLPMVHVSRALYSEPAAMVSTCVGTALLLLAWRSGRVRLLPLAGLALGATSLARIDGLLPVLGVTAGLGVLTLLRDDRDRTGWRWAPLLLAAGWLPPAAMAYLDLRLWSGVYVENLGGDLRLLQAAALASLVLAGASVLVRRTGPVGGWVRRHWTRLLAVVAGVVLAGTAFLLTRPWWLQTRSGWSNSVVEFLQAREGLAVDGRRTFGELSLSWLGWMYGWPTVLLGLGGLALMVWGARRRPDLLLVPLVGLPSAVLYLWQPSITPDLVWATRRYLPVVLPVLLVCLAHELGTVGAPGRRLRAPAIAVAAVLALLPGVFLAPVFDQRQKEGVADVVGQLCDQIDGRPTLAVGGSTYLPSIVVLCGVPTASLPGDASPARLALAMRRLGLEEAAVVTGAAAEVRWEDEVPAPTVVGRYTEWERVLTSRPDDVETTEVVIWVGSVDADGRAVLRPAP